MTHDTEYEGCVSRAGGDRGGHVTRVFYFPAVSTQLAAVLPAIAHAGSVLAYLNATNNSPLQQSVSMSGSLTT